MELAIGSLVPYGSNRIFLTTVQISSSSSLQVKNGLPLSAKAPGPSQLKDLPDPCASALSIPKASCTGSLPSMFRLYNIINKLSSNYISWSLHLALG